MDRRRLLFKDVDEKLATAKSLIQNLITDLDHAVACCVLKTCEYSPETLSILVMMIGSDDNLRSLFEIRTFSGRKVDLEPIRRDIRPKHFDLYFYEGGGPYPDAYYFRYLHQEIKSGGGIEVRPALGRNRH